MNAHNNYNKRLKEKARFLRANPTKAEIKLWTHILKAGKLKKYKFNRQRPIGNFIVDFFCKSLKLIIEVDGMSHVGNADKDNLRTKKLEELGYKFIRFSDNNILNNINGVYSVLDEFIEKYDLEIRDTLPPNPPPKGETSVPHPEGIKFLLNKFEIIKNIKL
jgi:very-short-patch-repair endonuclease